MVLKKIAWVFSDEDYKTEEAFNTALDNYQKQVLKGKEAYNPHEVVINTPDAFICYEAWIASEKELLENESLIDDVEEAFQEDNMDDGLFQVEIMAHLSAPNGQHFTALDIMYALHQQLSNKELGDHRFFEGLTTHEDDDNKVVYYMYLGS